MNNVQYDSTVIRTYARETLSKIKGVEYKLVDHLDRTKNLISGLTNKVEKMNLSKTKKPVPNSFLFKRNIKMQDPVKRVNRFPTLFPKEVASTSESEATEKITIASLFKDEEEDKKE